MKLVWKILALGLLGLLISCSSKIQRPQENTGYEYTGEKYGQVELLVNNKATDDLNDRVRFDDNKLERMIQKKLEVAGLINEDSVCKVKIEITDIRIRSSFNAFMWGVMAGDDHVVGDVTLLGEDEKPIYKFNVSASYALGGFAGMNETRMSWLFEEFSELTLKEIISKKTAKTE